MSEQSPGHRPKKTRKQRTVRTSQRNSDDATLTARGLRQKFENGTITDLLARREQSLGGPMNGPGALGDDTIHDIFGRIDTKFPSKVVDAVFAAINHTEVLPQVEARINGRKKKAGRPTEVKYRALMVAIMLTAMDGKGCLCSEIARTLYFRLDPTSMALLDIKPLSVAPTQGEQRQQMWRIERRVRSALRRFLITLDPSIHPTGKEMPWASLRNNDRPLTPEEILDNHDALTLVCNRILRIPYTLLPNTVRAKYRGSACIDGTPMRLHTRGKGINSLTASTDPNAGFYVRTGDHTDGGDPTIKKAFFAYDINLMVAACDHLGTNQYLPALPLAMHLDAPGVDPAGAARRVMADLASNVHKPGYLAGDGLYANATADAFHTPARSLGWSLVLPILDSHTGIQGSADGLVLVEGEWYCPSIPATLIDATKDFRAKAIDRTTYLQRINARETYRARNKGTNDSGTQRWGCPASGSHPAVICALKPRSEENKFIGGPVLGVRLKQRVIPNPDTQTNGTWPKPCRQESVTIDLRPGTTKTSDLAKYLQDLPFGTDQHTDIYNALRQSQEGFHGFAKDEAKEALGSPGKRRTRGYAAQSLFAAVLLAAAGIRKVRTFLANAVPDSNGDLYVTRNIRTGDHATTHLPPGSKGTRGDPDADDEDTATGVIEGAA